MTRTRKSILEMNHQEAKQFFLKTSSFFSTSLPNYIDLSVGIEKAVDLLKNKPFTELVRHKRSLSEAVDVNHRILANKDGNYAWRPLQILHPLVYVDLVNGITQKNNWNHIKNKFEEFQADKRIECISLPVESISSKSDTAETILNWWENLEQAQISYALEYDYCIHSDITDCYSSMYTHTIPWAVHSKEWAKTHRKDTQGVGNLIDSKIRYLQNGQTNGIPQGNVLMDFVAEIVLGYADKMLLNKIEKTEIKEFKILRYRDDYRIFSVRKDQAEVIIRLLSEVLSDLNLKLNSNKTFLSDNIILDAIKPDKIYWDLKHASFTEKSNNKWKF
ncbi:TPA: RNA-directed DNA polymerase, partial [Enterococcus faecium]